MIEMISTEHPQTINIKSLDEDGHGVLIIPFLDYDDKNLMLDANPIYILNTNSPDESYWDILMRPEDTSQWVVRDNILRYLTGGDINDH